MPAQTEIVFRDEKLFRFLIDAQLTVGAPSTLEDMWEVGQLINLALADGTLSVVSDNVNDTLGGTGAQRIVLRGNTSEAFPQFQSVEVDMDGTTPVVTDESFQGFSLAQARVILSNDLQRRDLPTGTITITQSASTVGIIRPNGIQTRHGFRRIPYGLDGEVQTWDLGAGNLSVQDTAGKADVRATATIWTFSPGDQAHDDAGTTINAGTDSAVVLPFGQDFASGEAFALRLEADQTGAIFFANVIANVTARRKGPVVVTHNISIA